MHQANRTKCNRGVPRTTYEVPPDISARALRSWRTAASQGVATDHVQQQVRVQVGTLTAKMHLAYVINWLLGRCFRFNRVGREGLGRPQYLVLDQPKVHT